MIWSLRFYLAFWFWIAIFFLVADAIINLPASGQARETRSGKPSTGKPAELVGSKDQRVRQNIRANNLGIGQVLKEHDMRRMTANGTLVEISDSGFYFIERGKAPRLSRKSWKGARCPPLENKIYVRPVVRLYLNQLAQRYFYKFNKKLKITSGTRSLEWQNLLRDKRSCHYTPYAAKADDPLEESLHVRGLAIDVSRKGMTSREIAWMRSVLVEDKLKGVEFEDEYPEDYDDATEIRLEPIEEKICYHIVVFPSLGNH